MDGKPFAFGLLRRRELVVPSWRGALALLLLCAVLIRIFLVSVHPFLAVTEPAGGEALVVEGWIPDYALREALITFRSHPYKVLITTGGPVPQGMAFSYHGNFARLSASMLEQMGLPADSIAEIPSPEVVKDRTYIEGVALKQWLHSRGTTWSAIDLFSFSTHARRSRLLYAMALGREIRVGIYAPLDLQYDAAHWWRSSAGVRRVTDEVIAYLYARLLFRY